MWKALMRISFDFGMARRSVVEIGFGEGAGEVPEADIAGFVLGRIVQRVGAHVAPEAVQPARGGGGAGRR